MLVLKEDGGREVFFFLFFLLLGGVFSYVFFVERAKKKKLFTFILVRFQFRVLFLYPKRGAQGGAFFFFLSFVYRSAVQEPLVGGSSR